MNNRAVSIFAVALLFIVCAPRSEGIKCWLCSSETDRRCGDPFNSTVLLRQEECNPTYGLSVRYVCRKVKHKVNEEVRVSRMCIVDGERENDPCSPTSLSNYMKVEYCGKCDTELCNSASQLSLLNVVVYVVVSTALIFVAKK